MNMTETGCCHAATGQFCARCYADRFLVSLGHLLDVVAQAPNEVLDCECHQMAIASLKQMHCNLHRAVSEDLYGRQSTGSANQ